MLIEIIEDLVPVVAIIALMVWAMVISMGRDFEGY
jgi:hypothetical protein